MCHPEALAEGALGTCVPREDKKGGVPWEDKKKSVPREDMVGGCHPEGKLRGLPGTSSRTKWGMPR